MVPGLKSRVDVLRDSYGVPQIYADNPEDLFLAQGYIQAQDRFFEMDFRRHLAAGRLSELSASRSSSETCISELSVGAGSRSRSWPYSHRRPVATLTPMRLV